MLQYLVGGTFGTLNISSHFLLAYIRFLLRNSLLSLLEPAYVLLAFFVWLLLQTSPYNMPGIACLDLVLL